MATKVSLSEKTYTFPDKDGYVVVSNQTSAGDSSTPTYLDNGELKPINVKQNTGTGSFYLTSIKKGKQNFNTLPGIQVNVAGPSSAPQKVTYLTVGINGQNGGAIKLYDGSLNDYTGIIRVKKLTDYREYTLPDDDGVLALQSGGNNYAEFRTSYQDIKPGQVVKETGNGDLVLATNRLERGCEIVSDVYGFSIGKTENDTLPIAVAGRVLAYPDADPSTFEIGAPVCSGENGTVSLMTEDEERMYPSRIIGTVSEIPTYETWTKDNKKIPVDGRIWVRVR